MGLVSAPPFPPDNTGNPLHALLLPTGNVLAVTLSTAAFILEPNDLGDYAAGTWRRIANMPYAHQFNSVTMANDGTIYFHGAEYNSGIGKTSIFDPWKETWSSNSDPVGSHTSVAVCDDGRIIGFRGDFLPGGTLRVRWTGPDGDPASYEGYESTTPDGAEGYYWNESGWFQLPDGRLALFSGANQPNSPRFTYFKPQYAADVVDAGSLAGDNTFEHVILTTQLDALPQHVRGYESSRRWHSNGADINYEVGPSFWHPGILKAVILGGDGVCFAFDPATGTVEHIAFAGLTPPSTGTHPLTMGDSRRVGTFATSNTSLVNKTVENAIFGGTVLDITVPPGTGSTVAAQLQSAVPAPVVVRLSPNGWAYIEYSTAVEFDTATVRLSGLTRSQFLGGAWAQTDAKFQYNLDVIKYDPTYAWRDAPGCFLPNGDFMSLAGLAINMQPGFQDHSEFLKWDGVSQTMSPLLPDHAGYSTSRKTYNHQLLALPDGNILAIGISASWCRIYQPTTAELTPQASWKPVITNAPPLLSAGRTFKLRGQQLNGLHEGGFFGDDSSPRTNFPLVRLTNTATGIVRYCRTRKLHYRGIQPGRVSTADIEVPFAVPTGLYNMQVVASGIASDAVTVEVVPSVQGDSISLNSFAYA